MKAVLVLPGNDNFRSSAISQAGAEHLGLGYIASYSRKQGHEITIVNFQAKSYLSYWQIKKSNSSTSTNNNVSDIIKYKPKVVGISVTGVTIREVIQITNDIKYINPDIYICWGGHQAYQSAKDILMREKNVDSIVVGDGEITFAKILDSIEKNHCFSEISGIWYRENGKIRFTGKPPEPELDTLPFPDRDTLKELSDIGANITDARISTSRGCPFNCTFCVDPSLGYRKKWRARSALKVVEELSDVVLKYGINFFWFSEDNFIPPTSEGRKRANEIAKLIIERDIKISYRALLRADAIDGQTELLDNLVKSGLNCVYIGIESGSPRRLNYFKKHETPDLYRRAIKLLRKYNIGLQIGFIMFDPLTSWDDLILDADFLLEIQEMYLYSNFCQILDVFPGAEISKILIEKGLLSKDFTYDSPIDKYRFFTPDIGKMAHIIQASYKDKIIDLDKFLQRLKVVDIPNVKRNIESSFELDDFYHEMDCLFNRANENGYNFFMSSLEIARNSWEKRKFDKIFDSYYDNLLNMKKCFLKKISGCNPNLKQYLSAAKPYL